MCSTRACSHAALTSEVCCRCKNQWNKLAGRNKRAAASEPSNAKRAKISPAAPSLGSDKPSEQSNRAAKKRSRRNPYICKRCGQIKKGHVCSATHLKCGECATWYPLDEICIGKKEADKHDWRCGVCKGTHVRTEQPARAKKVRRCLIVRCVS